MKYTGQLLPILYSLFLLTIYTLFFIGCSKEPYNIRERRIMVVEQVDGLLKIERDIREFRLKHLKKDWDK